MSPLSAILLTLVCGQTDPVQERLKADVQKLASFGTRHTLSDADHETRGIGAARRWIKAEFWKIATPKSRTTVSTFEFLPPRSPRVPQPEQIVNVYALLPGTDPVETERIYVVSGHYDSRALDVLKPDTDAPGANDDASGVAVVLELFRHYVKHPAPATLMFLAFAGEEQGLIGSRYVAKIAHDNDWNLAGMITNDIVGNSIGRDGKPHRGEIRVFSEGIPRALIINKDEEAKTRGLRILASVGGEWDSPSRQLARFVRSAVNRDGARTRVRLVFRPDRFLRGGDHLPFNEFGFPAIRFTEPFENFDRQHQDVRVEDGREYGDLPANVDYVYLARVAEANRKTLTALAFGPPRPRDVVIDTKKLENDTTLRWTAPPGKRVIGYDIVWRETTDAFWQNSRHVGAVTEITLQLSKDDFHFGVRSVDAEGRRSPVVFPKPVR
ncbi:MAG: M28 family metallopeptidase [Planctomycetota bacterium]